MALAQRDGRVAPFVPALLISCAACTPQDASIGERPPRYVSLAADAGATLDAGVDAGRLTEDAGPFDAGTLDAGIADAGSGPLDAGADPISNRGVTNPACPELSAQITAWSFPPAITSRFTRRATLTVKNTGTTTWSGDDDVQLGSPDDSDPFVEAARVRLEPGVTVAPGASHTFELTLRAPEPAGRSVTDWQMLQEQRCWFGERLTLELESRAPVATGQCVDPTPPGVDEIAAVVHIVGPNRITLDSTAKVCDRDYCSSIGFTDFRTCCPARAEGHPDVEPCNAALVGVAPDTGRVGPTWRFNGQLCGPAGPGDCTNHPTNQFLLFVYGPGTATACSNTNSVCGTVVVP